MLCGGQGILYGNVIVHHLAQDSLANTLTVNVVYAERERQRAVYTGVLYSQLDKSAEGMCISVVTELTPDDLRNGGHESAVGRLLRECSFKSIDSIDEMLRRGYRLFSHYAGIREEYIVVAKGLRIDTFS